MFAFIMGLWYAYVLNYVKLCSSADASIHHNVLTMISKGLTPRKHRNLVFSIMHCHCPPCRVDEDLSGASLLLKAYSNLSGRINMRELGVAQASNLYYTVCRSTLVFRNIKGYVCCLFRQDVFTGVR